MPVDKNAVLNGNGKAQQPAQAQPTTDETTALTALTQTAAGTIRQSIGAMTQLAEKLEDQRDLVTDHAAERVAAILDPQSIQAEIAVKTLSRLEGKSFVPFELEAIAKLDSMIEMSKTRRIGLNSRQYDDFLPESADCR